MKSYFFPHDYDASNDAKMIKLIKSGWEYYGLYWGIVERLHKEGGYLPLDYETLAYDLRTQYERITSVIRDFDLFIIEGDKFTTNRVLKNLEYLNSRSNKAKASVLKRWNKTTSDNVDTNVLPSYYDSNTIKLNKTKLNNKKLRQHSTQEEFEEDLKKTYDYVDIETELKKMDMWLSTRPERRKTKRFVINWLNKIEKPLAGTKKYAEPKSL